MKRKKPGFTLIEIIIVLALTVIILAIESSIFITGNKVFSDSDVKSTLQVEGQTIEENLSNIGMQAEEMTSAQIQNGEVKNLTIKSYDNDYNIRYFKIWINGKTLTIDKCKNSDGSEVESSQDLSKNIGSFKISYNGNLNDANCVEFIIKLSNKKGFTNVDNYPIDFKVTFRNNGLTQ